MFRNAGRKSLAHRVSSSRLVRITPRNSQLPCSRLTRLVCLPCQPKTRRLGQRLFHDRRGIDKHFQFDRRAIDDEPRQRLERLLDRLMIIAALGIDRDARERQDAPPSASGSVAGA